jgi:hypothetical protein
MKLALTPTSVMQFIDGVQCRRWTGVTDRGVAVHAYVAVIMPLTNDEAVLRDFEHAFQKLPEPEISPAELRFPS